MFVDVQLLDPAHLDRDDELGWWAKEDFEVRTFRAQQHLLASPGTVGLAAQDPRARDEPHCKGVCITLAELWARRHNLFQQVQLLKAAVLFPVLDSHHRRSSFVAQHIPPYDVQRAIQEQLWAQAGIEESPWAGYHADVLPRVPREDDLRGQWSWERPHFARRGDYEDPLNFLIELDRLAGRVMTHWLPVRIRYAADPDTADRLRARHKAAEESAGEVRES